MDTPKIVTLGASIFLSATIFIAYVLNAWGQIKGTFSYVPPESLIELFKWAVGSAGFIGTASAVVSGVVAYRAANEDKKPE